MLDNVVSKQNQYGIAVGTGIYGIVSRSSISNNVDAGIEADAGSRDLVEDSMITNNGIGAQISGLGDDWRTTVVIYNTTGLSGGGTITTYGNNRLFGNRVGWVRRWCLSVARVPTSVRNKPDAADRRRANAASGFRSSHLIVEGQ